MGISHIELLVAPSISFNYVIIFLVVGGGDGGDGGGGTGIAVAVAALVTHVTFTLAECVTSEHIYPWTSNISANNVQSKVVGSIHRYPARKCDLSLTLTKNDFHFYYLVVSFHKLCDTIRHYEKKTIPKFLTQITPKNFGGLNIVLLAISILYFYATHSINSIHEKYVGISVNVYFSLRFCHGDYTLSI